MHASTPASGKGIDHRLLRAAWLEREAQTLLPVDCYHVVFTLPAGLGPLALQNPRVLYDLLLRTAWETVRELASDPHYLGATVGLLAVLHTWGQTLCHHPDVHCVVTGGGRACDVDGRVEEPPRWVSCRPGFFLPVRVLSRLFRGKFLAGLRTAYDTGQVGCHGQLAALAEPEAFRAWLAPLYGQELVVYAKPPFGGPQQVLKYLAGYTHRVAIGNSRLVSCNEDRVTFCYKDYADDRRHRTMALSAHEFIRRFLQHVLPSGFVKIRHYGLLANRYREANLRACRALLLVATLATLLTGASQDGECGVGERRWRASGISRGSPQPMQEVERIVGVLPRCIEADDEVDGAVALRDAFEALTELAKAGRGLDEGQFIGRRLQVVAQVGGVVAVARGVDADADADARGWAGRACWRT